MPISHTQRILDFDAESGKMTLGAVQSEKENKIALPHPEIENISYAVLKVNEQG